MACIITFSGYQNAFGVVAGEFTLNYPEGTTFGLYIKSSIGQYEGGIHNFYGIRINGTTNLASTGNSEFDDNVFLEGSLSISANCNDGFDCLNGSVVSASLYGTPGIFPSEAQAQSSCGGVTCNGVCLTTSEYNGIKAKLEQFKVQLS